MMCESNYWIKALKNKATKPLWKLVKKFTLHQHSGAVTSVNRVGGFNFSNLMGIKGRMIDIGKKITFYFLRNVWKFTDFFICIMTQKKFFLKNINMGIKKRWILCWFQIRWCRLKQMTLKKARAKKLWEFWVFSFLCIFSWFFAFNFC
jgi:hypothetical protein